MPQPGDPEAARAESARAYDAARAAGDVQATIDAALRLATTKLYGTVAGRAPAFLHEAYSLAAGAQRARLAIAVARAWAYAGEPDRGASFAQEALAFAEAARDAALLADALDASLLVHWGPDDLQLRLAITARLENTAAHVVDPEPRLAAHLWRMTTALECLDISGVRRQLRGLELLAAESGTDRLRFFAASRRGMYALLTNDLEQAEISLAATRAAGTAAGEADTYALERTLTANLARQRADVETLAREAQSYEEFGTTEGVRSVLAESAVLWLEAGNPDRAQRMLVQAAGDAFRTIPRDADWLLTVASLAEVAAALPVEPLAGAAIEALTPYAGRGVVNAGAVGFVGVVDDYLARACSAVGRDTDATAGFARARRAYETLGAAWWLRRLPPSAPAPVRTRDATVHLHRSGDGIWCVGTDDQLTLMRDMKGLHYLRLLVASPGVDLPAQDLSDVVAGHPGVSVKESDAGELLDRRAIAAYRTRLQQLDDDLDQATANADEGRAALISLERDALLDQLRAARGWGGRSRRASGSTERARVAVRKAIVAAMERIRTVDPGTGGLLERGVSTGTVCRFDPDPARPVRWQLTDEGTSAG